MRIVTDPSADSETISISAYTDAPHLHPGWLPGTAQLLAWLLFHPSAWRNYLACLDPTLPPDFSLAGLTAEQRRNPCLQRILLLGYVIVPLAVGVIAGLVALLTGLRGGFPAHFLHGVTYTLVAGLAIGVTVSVAAGIIYGLVLGLLIVTTLPILHGLSHGFIYGAAAAVTSSVLLSLTGSKVTYSLRGFPEIISFSRLLFASMNSRLLKKYLAGFALGTIISGLLVILILDVVTGQLVNDPGVAPANEPVDPQLAVILGLIGGLLYGLVYGSMTWQRSHRWRLAAIVGLVAALAGGIGYGLLEGLGTAGNATLYNVAAGFGGGLLFAGLFALPYLLVSHLAGNWAGAIAGTLVAGVSWIPLAPYIFPEELPGWPSLLRLSLVAVLLGLTLTWWRPILLYPLLLLLNQLLYHNDGKRSASGSSLLRFHAAFWDELQWLPWVGLDAHLALIAERAPAEVQAAINYLATSRQRWAAQVTQLELLLRELEECTNITAIENAHRLLAGGRLEDSAGSWLNQFSSYSQDVKAARNHVSAYHKRRALNEVCNRLNNFIRELNLADDPYARRCQPIAIQWYHVLVSHLEELVRAIEPGQEIDNPYIFSSPLTEEQGVFVGRNDIVGRIEQLLRDSRRPPLLLYGQRRMGKTSLLRNLGRLLPSTILPLFVDGQGAALASNYAEFLYSVAKQMVKSAEIQRGLQLSSLSRETLLESPFIIFNDWLDEVEREMTARGKSMALLTLDEIEALARVTERERFNAEDLLNLFRNLIQHRPRFKVLLAGSHTLDEFQRWASFLINMQVLKISYLEPTEALQLIERPIPDFALTYEPGASQHVLKLTRGHPHLVQLLCHEVVMLKNRQPRPARRTVTLADVEAAVASALDVGNFFFADIQQNQVDEAGLALLRFMAAQGEDTVVSRPALADHCPDQLEGILAALLRRDLIEAADGGYRFQVEMIRRWFEQLNE